MSENLLDITRGLQQLLFKVDEIEQAGSVPSPEMLTELNNIVDKQADKVDRSVSFYKFCEGQIEWLKSEKDSMDLLIKRYERAMERMEYLARIAMSVDGVECIEGKFKKISIRKSEFVDVIDQSQIPDSHMRIKTMVEVDKQKIKEDLKRGLDVPGAALGIRSSVVFK